jgi:RNA polymerase-binding transcription factor DksA
VNIAAAKAALLAKQAKLNRHTRDSISIKPTADPTEAMQQISDREVAVHALDHAGRTRRAIYAALVRLDAAVYGRCLECDEQISDARLKALPEAELCIACQTESERQSRLNGEIRLDALWEGA